MNAALHVYRGSSPCQISKDGFELINGFIDREAVDAIIDDVDVELSKNTGGGIRNPEKKFKSIVSA